MIHKAQILPHFLDFITIIQSKQPLNISGAVAVPDSTVEDFLIIHPIASDGRPLLRICPNVFSLHVDE